MQSERRLFFEDGIVRSYAIRRVNPFLGVSQIIETSDGRATSANGVVWDIEVRAEVGGGWGSLNRSNTEIAYYRYGLWSAEVGLVARPLSPMMQSDPLVEQCESLIECVQKRLGLLPFRLVDKHELWLLDSSEKQPLVLLASAIDSSALPSPEPRYWVSCIGAHGVKSQFKFPHASKLEAMVKQRAGFNIKKRWITRQTDGSLTDAKNEENIESLELPPFLLTMEWQDKEQSRLAREYIEWISPSLLTLQNLDKQDRARVESTLAIQAMSVDYHWHLYPEVIDEENLNAVRVQGLLQKTNQVREGIS
jgi:hypothetical protein